jgi:predicted nucleotidyltransferase
MKPFEAFVQGLAARLGQIEGVVAVALGGSWARSDAYSDSDIDLAFITRPNVCLRRSP